MGKKRDKIIIITLILFLIVSIVVVVLISDKWVSRTQVFGGNQGRTHVYNTKPVTLLHEVLWKLPLPEGIILTSPLIYNDMIYLQSISSTIYAFDLNTQQELWHFSVNVEGERQLVSAPVITDDILFATTANADLYALDTITGVELWRFQSNDNLVSASVFPAMADGVVYFETLRQTNIDDVKVLYAIDAQTGEEKWSFQKPIVVDGYALLASVPAIADGTIYFQGLDNYLYAIDVDTGRERWRFNVANAIDRDNVAIYPSSVTNGTVYFIVDNDYLFAIDTKTGLERWHTEGDFDMIFSPPVTEHTVYSTNLQGTLFAFDTMDGQEKRRAEVNAQTFGKYSLIAGDIIYTMDYGDEGHLYAFDTLTAERLWSYPVENGVVCATIDDGVIYFIGREADRYFLFALR